MENLKIMRKLNKSYALKNNILDPYRSNAKFKKQWTI